METPRNLRQKKLHEGVKAPIFIKRAVAIKTL